MLKRKRNAPKILKPRLKARLELVSAAPMDPTLKELRRAKALSTEQIKEQRLTAAQDIAWALINNPSFYSITKTNLDSHIPGGINNDPCDDGASAPHAGIYSKSVVLACWAYPWAPQMQAKANESGHGGGPGWGRAKSVILVYLQGKSESHRSLGPQARCPR